MCRFLPACPPAGPNNRTALGSFSYHHIKLDYLFRLRQQEVAPNQLAFLALAEKALLDLVYLTPGANTISYLRELRLQHTKTIDGETLEKQRTEWESQSYDPPCG